MNACHQVPEYRRLAGLTSLSKRTTQQLNWLDHYLTHDQNAGMTRRYFGISPQTSYRWSTSYSRTHLEGLEDREASIQERATAFLFRGTGYGYSLTEGRLTLGQRQAAGTAWQQQIP